MVQEHEHLTNSASQSSANAEIPLILTLLPENSVTTTKFGLLPWQLDSWKRLMWARSNNQLHHAHLICGLPGLGKLHFAYNLAYSLLCTDITKDGNPCGCCRSCHLLRVGNHPDLRLVVPDPEKKSGEITVDTIRALLEFDTLMSQAGGYKVIIIAPADAMNRSAANSVLKILEEPRSSTILLLVTAKPWRLLPTVRSRCVSLQLTVPPAHEASAWLAKHTKSQDSSLALQLARGAPLAALNLSSVEILHQRQQAIEAFLGIVAGRNDPVIVAGEWTKQNLHLLLTWMSSWLADLLRLQTGAERMHLDNPDLSAVISKHGIKLNPVDLHKMWSKVIDAIPKLQTTVNRQLLIETLLIQWSNIQP